MKTFEMIRTPRLFRSALIGMLLLSFSFGAASAVPDEDPYAFRVEVTGDGPPMLLIPGLASGGDVWDETVAYYKERYRCHVLTLAGFAGVPATERTPFLKTVRDDILAYMEANGVKRPVIVGHSLGGFLALWVAATAPDAVGPVVVVDALPFLPAAQTPGVTPEHMEPQARQMRDMIASRTPEQFRRYEAQTLPTMISDSADVARALETVARSDPKAVGQALYELLTTDLREDLSRITVPVLVIGTWVGYQPYATREQVAAMFEAQYARLSNARIVLADDARHFVMYDDLEGMLEETDAFLESIDETAP
ncbi:alpha/beta fold hydrolase [Rhodocaloribacter sp.]